MQTQIKISKVVTYFDLNLENIVLNALQIGKGLQNYYLMLTHLSQKLVKMYIKLFHKLIIFSRCVNLIVY